MFPVRLSGSWVWPAALFLVASLFYCRAFITPFVQDGSWTARYDAVDFASTADWRAADRLLLTGHDWDVHYFYQTAVQRSVVGDRQWPFWNPWTKGGASLWGNPEVQFPTPLSLVNLIAGPIGGARLQVVLHHWIGLVGAWWLARLLGYSRRASILASCTFMLSTWYSLHLAAGHATFWSAAYMPIALGCLWLARRDLRWALGAAAWLTLMIFEGGTYVYLIFLVLAGVITVAWAAQSRSWRPFAAVTLAILFSAGFAAIRLLPQAAMLARYPRTTEAARASYDQLGQDLDGRPGTAPADAPGSLQSGSTEPTMDLIGVEALVGQIGKIFLGRDQQVGRFYYRYQGYGWHEYGAYIGPAAIGLLLLGPIVLSRQRSALWPWYAGGALCFLLALGNFASFSPWALLHELPFYNHTRVPSRYLIPCLLCLAMAAAAGYDALWRRFAARSGLVRALFDVALVLACADLALVGGRAFQNDAESTRVSIPPAPTTVTTVVAGQYQQTALAIAGYRAQNGYEAIPVISHAAAVGEPGYKGEVYVELPAARADQSAAPAPQGLEYTWSAGRLTLQRPAVNEGWVVWNMNWAPGWRSDPPGLIESRNGLLAVALRGDLGPVTLYYVPERLAMGLGISLAAVLAAGAWLYAARSRPRAPRLRSEVSPEVLPGGRA